MTEEFKTESDSYAERLRKQDERERNERRRARGQDVPEVQQGTAPTEPVGEAATDEPDGAPA